MTDKFDLDDDGVVTEDEINRKERMINITNTDEKSDTQKKMAWIALFSMIGYAIIPLLPFVNEERLPIISAMSDTLFLALASVIGFFFGVQAYMSKK